MKVTTSDAAVKLEMLSVIRVLRDALKKGASKDVGTKRAVAMADRLLSWSGRKA